LGNRLADNYLSNCDCQGLIKLSFELHLVDQEGSNKCQHLICTTSRYQLQLLYLDKLELLSEI
jgi:hypothetical protein